MPWLHRVPSSSAAVSATLARRTRRRSRISPGRRTIGQCRANARRRSPPGPRTTPPLANWEYSKQLCDDNARIEGVAARTTFLQQSGAALEFADGSFDAVVSCLTFHEIRDVERKTDGVVDALRVLRPGGRYAFLDLFGDPSFYPSIEDVRATIGRAGATIVECRRLADCLPLPFPLRHPRCSGTRC